MKSVIIALLLGSTSYTLSQSAIESPKSMLERRLKAHKALIAQWDTNKDGKLDEKEQKAWNEQRFGGKKLALDKFDTDKDGRLSVEECWKGNQAYAKYEMKIYVKDWAIDKNKDGTVSEEERQALQEQIEEDASLPLRREFFRSRLRLDSNKDGKIAGAELTLAQDFDLDLEIQKRDTNEQGKRDKEGERVETADPWDGQFTEEERAGLLLFIERNRFVLEKSDGDQDGVVSKGEEEANVLPEPTKRSITDASGRKIEATLIDASPLTVQLAANQNTFYLPVNRLGAVDQKFITEWMATAKSIHPFTPLKLKAADGLEITADFYDTGDKSKPIILYGHRAMSSRGEYRVIASRLAKLGYNGIAIDMRSGQAFAGVANETTAAWTAKDPSLPPVIRDFGYDNSKPDMEAALQWIKQQGFTGPLILWGSSYSSSLAILLASKDSAVDAVLAFAPGEWLQKKGSVAEAAAKLKRPTLVVHPKAERSAGEPVIQALPNKELVMDYEILHGSNTLLKGTNRAATWETVIKFLASVKNVPVPPEEESMLNLIVGTHWEKVGGSKKRTFGADGTFGSNDDKDPFTVTGHRTLTIHFSKGNAVPCKMNADCTELDTGKFKWKRVP